MIDTLLRCPHGCLYCMGKPGCPFVNQSGGDCASANPPVVFCPKRDALAAAAREGGDVQQAPGETPQSGLKGNAQ